MDITLEELTLVIFAIGVGIFVLIIALGHGDTLTKIAGIAGGIAGILFGLLTLIN